MAYGMKKNRARIQRLYLIEDVYTGRWVDASVNKAEMQEKVKTARYKGNSSYRLIEKDVTMRN